MPSPITNATLQATAISFTANVLAQFIEAYRGKRPFALDLIQLLRFVTLSLITTPPNYKWQQFLERTFPATHVPETASDRQHDVEKGKKKLSDDVGSPKDNDGKWPKLNLRNTLTKWFVDCITVGAIMNTVAFLVLMGILKGQSTAQIGHNIKTETIPIIVAGYKIWPIASIISFSFIPVERRIVFLSFIGLLWGIYMSLVAARV